MNMMYLINPNNIIALALPLSVSLDVAVASESRFARHLHAAFTKLLYQHTMSFKLSIHRFGAAHAIILICPCVTPVGVA